MAQRKVPGAKTKIGTTKRAELSIDGRVVAYLYWLSHGKFSIESLEPMAMRAVPIATAPAVDSQATPAPQ